MLITGICIGVLVRKDRRQVAIATWGGIYSTWLIIAIAHDGREGSNLIGLTPVLVAWFILPPMLLGYVAGSVSRRLA